MLADDHLADFRLEPRDDADGVLGGDVVRHGDVVRNRHARRTSVAAAAAAKTRATGYRSRYSVDERHPTIRRSPFTSAATARATSAPVVERRQWPPVVAATRTSVASSNFVLTRRP